MYTWAQNIFYSLQNISCQWKNYVEMFLRGHRAYPFQHVKMLHVEGRVIMELLLTLRLSNVSVSAFRKLSYFSNEFVQIIHHTLSRFHYDDVIMSAIASQITSLAIVNSTVYSNADKKNHQSSASLAFVWGIHRGPVNSPHKWPVTRKMFPFDDVIMSACYWTYLGEKNPAQPVSPHLSE